MEEGIPPSPKSCYSTPPATSSNVAILSSNVCLQPPPASPETSPRNVVVIFDTSREPSTSALEWTAEKILQPGDALTLLGILHQVITPSTLQSPLPMGIANFLGYKSRVDFTSFNGVNLKSLEEEAAKKTKYFLSKSSNVQKICENQKATLEVRVEARHPLNLAAVDEARKLNASWVILDRNLRRHRKYISEQLSCNIILMGRNNEGKILKLCGPVVLGPAFQFHDMPSDSSMLDGMCKWVDSTLVPSSSNIATSSGDSPPNDGSASSSYAWPSDTEPSTPTSVSIHPSATETLMETCEIQDPQAPPSKEDAALSKQGSPEHQQLIASQDVETMGGEETLTAVATQNVNEDMDEANEISRDMISMPKQAGPLPLCSVCKQKSPDFGRQTKEFTYAELEEATDKFAQNNFLAEGGYGSVYKGVLKDGQHIAVKQHKLASTQGDKEFCAEVQVLSCAQHRNLITLLGYCVEGGRRMLVYEFICNKSLDWHLSARRKQDVLPWSARQAIALGAARGLRYLHEECRVGCIVHRDLRPNNILLTHDYTPMVGDFGLARWQVDEETAVETRVIGTLGYLAPEYTATGQVTDKADVYSFGVVLLELITGRRVIDLSLPEGETCLTEWARPKLEVRDADALLDSRLETFDMYEVQCMIHAAAFCLRREPSQRPKMTQILRILEEGEKDEAPTLKSTASWDLSASTSRPSSATSIRRVSSIGSMNASGKSGLSYKEMIVSLQPGSTK